MMMGGGRRNRSLKDTDEAIPVSKTVRFFAPRGLYILQSTPANDASTLLQVLAGGYVFTI
jgi:hypothetical protein